MRRLGIALAFTAFICGVTAILAGYCYLLSLLPTWMGIVGLVLFTFGLGIFVADTIDD